MEHRNDIDGLRAIAIIPVVLYHAGFSLFSGGFVGVDVFFVISGYLITGMISNQISKDSFSIITFYERRIRRLFPALLLMLCFTSVLSAIFLAPSELKAFGARLVSSLLFLSNVHFWRQSGYFDDTASLNPLLHMWSLSVEEQFYVLFPILLLLLYRLRIRPLPVVVIIFLCSLATGIWQSINSPSAAFYLPFSRAWELMLGSLLALNLLPQIRHKVFLDIVSVLGIAMVLLATICFNESTVFPGSAALIPCVGAAMLIYSGNSSRTGLVNVLLCQKPLVYIGLISYSLYLFHWPIFSFLDVFIDTEKIGFGFSTVVGISLSFLLASVSYHFIEQPVRERHFWRDRRRLFVSGIVATFILGVFGIAFYGAHGFPQRYQLSDQFYDDMEVEKHAAREAYQDGTCFLGGGAGYGEFDDVSCGLNDSLGKVLLVGDSFAAHLLPGLQATLSNRVVQLTAGECRPLMNVETLNTVNCIEVRRYWFDILFKKKWVGVILSGRWQTEEFAALAETISQIRQNTDQVFVIGPSIEYQGKAPELYSVYGESRLIKSRTDLSRIGVDKAMAEFVATTGAEYLSIIDVLCSERPIVEPAMTITMQIEHGLLEVVCFS